MNGLTKKVFLGVILVLCIISCYNIIRWYNWYKKIGFEFAVDLDSFLEQGIDLERLIEEFKKIGVKKFFVNVSYVGEKFLFEKLGSDVDKNIIIKITSDQKYSLEYIDNIISKNLYRIFSLYLEDKDRNDSSINSLVSILSTSTLSSKKFTERSILYFIEKFKLAKLNFEHNYVRGVIYKPSFRSFLLNLNDMKDYSYEYIKKIGLIKLKKAIFERSCYLVYIIPSDFLTYKENLNIINFFVSNFVVHHYEKTSKSFETIYFKKISNMVVIILAVLFPILIFRFFYQKINLLIPTKLYFTINIYSIFLGVVLWGLLQRYEFVSLEEHIYGIKLAFVLPIVVMPFFILNKKEIKNLLNYNLKIKHMVSFFGVFLLFLYIVIRTSNVDKKFLLPYEIQIRNFIETYILFRPRFKEVFFAQPLLFLSLNLLKYNYNSLWIKLLYSFSIICSVSILNTFFHVHTPIWLCIGRSLLSAILGFFIGNLILFLIKIKI